jgi:hypothetical protein
MNLILTGQASAMEDGHYGADAIRLARVDFDQGSTASLANVYQRPATTGFLRLAEAGQPAFPGQQTEAIHHSLERYQRDINQCFLLPPGSHWLSQ